MANRSDIDNGSKGLGCAIIALIVILILALIAYDELSIDDYGDGRFYERTSIPISIKKHLRYDYRWYE